MEHSSPLHLREAANKKPIQLNEKVEGDGGQARAERTTGGRRECGVDSSGRDMRDLALRSGRAQRPGFANSFKRSFARETSATQACRSHGGQAP